MTKSPSKKANDYLKTEQQDANSIFVKIRELTELNKLVMPFIPEELRDYCHVANLVNKQLILMTANGSVATQLRFQSADLLRKFKQDSLLSRIQGIHCKVSPSLSVNTHKGRKEKITRVAPLTPETANVIKEMADSIEDPKLKEIMLRISKRVQSNNE